MTGFIEKQTNAEQATGVQLGRRQRPVSLDRFSPTSRDSVLPAEDCSVFAGNPNVDLWKPRGWLLVY